VTNLIFLVLVSAATASAFAGEGKIPKRTLAQAGTKASLWVYDDSIDAETFLASQQFQKEQIEILFTSKDVKKIIGEQGAELALRKQALMVKAYGCGAHASGGNNLCEVAFVVYDPTSPVTEKQKIFARLFARVNVTERAVSSVAFEKE
jgi:hypothetical protein